MVRKQISFSTSDAKKGTDNTLEQPIDAASQLLSIGISSLPTTSVELIADTQRNIEPVVTLLNARVSALAANHSMERVAPLGLGQPWMAAVGAWVNGLSKHVSALAQTSSQDLVLTISTPMVIGFALGIMALLLVVVIVYATSGRTDSACGRTDSGLRWRKPVFAPASDSETPGSSDGTDSAKSFQFVAAESVRPSVAGMTPVGSEEVCLSASMADSLSGLPMEKNESNELLVTMSGHRRDRRKLFRGATDELKEKMLNVHSRQLEARGNPEVASRTSADEGKRKKHTSSEWPMSFGPSLGELCTIDSGNVSTFDSSMEANVIEQKKKMQEKAAAFAQLSLPVAPQMDDEDGGV